MSKTSTKKASKKSPKTEATTGAKTTRSKPTAGEKVDAPSCPDCGSPMVRRTGKFGEFFGCSKFKDGECRATLPVTR